MGFDGVPTDDVALGGVTELRVHGVGGTTAESMLFDPKPVRVAGDDTAGFFRTADHPVDGRHVEAYAWGALTSRPWTRALWLLLFPFAVANVAGWTQRRAADDRHMIDPRTTWAGRVVRLLALSLTVLVVVGVAYVAYDAVALQCGAVTACAETRWWTRLFTWSVLAERPGARLAAASLLPVVIVLAIWFLARRTGSNYESRLPPAEVLDGDDVPRLARKSTWMRARGARRDSWIHLGASLAAIAIVLALAAGQVTRRVGWAQAIVVAAVVVLVLLSLLLMRTSEDRTPFDPLAVVLVAGVFLGAIALAVFGAPDRIVAVPLTWSSRVNQYVFATQLALLLVLFVLCLAAARGAPAGGVRAFRWVAPVVFTGLGVLTAGSALSGMNVRVADVLGRPVALEPGDDTVDVVPAPTTTTTTIQPRPELERDPPVTVTSVPATPIGYPASADWSGLAMAGAVAALVASVATVAITRVLTIRKEAVAGVLSEYGLPTSPSGTAYERKVFRRRWAWAKSIERMRAITRTVRIADGVVSGLVLGLLLIITVVVVVHIGRSFRPLGWRWVATGSSWVVAALPLVAVGTVRAARSDLAKRKTLGILWDLGSFWPRWFHPWAPPSYSERAVPDLQARLFALTDEGCVLLSAHSQGSIIAAAAVRGLPPERRKRIALVTYGAPLAFLYPHVFPGSFLPSPAVGAGLHSWHNFWRQTDPIGGSVGGAAGEVPPTIVDEMLPDPATANAPPGGPFPAIAGHSHYLEDSIFQAACNGIAASLRGALPSAP